jgi:hypothetical protein
MLTVPELNAPHLSTEDVMAGARQFWRSGLLVTAATVTLVWITGASWSEHKAQHPSGPTIQFGAGHFNRDAKAFHYWDNEKEIPAVCTRCHTIGGVPQYLAEGRTGPGQHVKNAFACTTCHADLASYARHTASKVTFPSGISVDTGVNDSNLCMTCHQGRESTVSVNKALEGLDPDKPEPKLNYIHVHYAGAGGTNFGTQAKVGYEYAGKTYAGRFNHVPTANTCTGCHDPHRGEVAAAKCSGCHEGIRGDADLAKIRMTSRGDFDGNGKEEGVAQELAGLHKELYTAIQQYARTVGGVAIAFAEHGSHPYWHADRNGNGIIDPEEMNPANKYPAYTPRLMQAIYNYSFVARDPGAAYHNGRYATQLLYDSLESLAASGKAGVTMQGKARP